MRKSLFASLIAGLALLGCDANTTAPDVEPQLSYNDDGGETRTYRVTVYNLTATQPLTPPLVATHAGDVRFFRVGHPASEGIKEIAENGNLGPMNEALLANDGVSDVVIALSDPPPLLQNESVTFEIDADGDARFLSWVSMLICTNDGFTGRNRIRLPNRVGGMRSARARAYDAGTEINTEDFADIVPPCQIFGHTSSDDAGTGMSNPELAENGRIRRHRGIKGIADLTYSHEWTNPVAKIEIERIS